MRLALRSYLLFFGASAALLAAANACEDSSATPASPDASASVSPDAATGNDAAVRVDASQDAGVDAQPDARVIVGCVPQEISTRYDAVWLFGTRCRADWNASNQVTFSEGPIAFAGIEGTICAANPFTGALFAASDGVDLYVGDGGKTNDASLGANISAAQPVAFLGKPGSSSDFYVVTNASAAGTGTAGLYYSTLPCGSATPDGPPALIAGTTQFTEALMSVRHANNIDRWLLSVATTGIAVLPVTSTGFGAPVITDFGGTLSGVVAGQRTFIAFARDRRTFAITAEGIGLVTGQFDNTTGTISGLVARPVPSTTTLYSAAFSPDGTKLYASEYNGSFWQIDLAAAPDAGVSASLGEAFGALRLAIDDKIYLAQWSRTSLTVVQNPNAAAGSLTVTSATLPSGCTSSYGLPGVGDL